MHALYQNIEELLNYGVKKLYLAIKDLDYIRNRIYYLLHLEGGYYDFVGETDKPLEELLTAFVDLAVENKLFKKEDSVFYLDLIMSELSLLPSELEKRFHLETNKMAFLYQYQIDNYYLKINELNKNICFESNGLFITINLTKPNKMESKLYPLCPICHQNEGYLKRKTLRTIDLCLNNEKWFWQFSPYGYFREHGIAVSYRHEKMEINHDTFVRLCDFVDLYPEYFIGSNAALPKVGGSILGHNHYQGGAARLPLLSRKSLFSKKEKDFKIEIIDWPMNVIKITSFKRESIINLSTRIYDSWKDYNNPSLGIIACSALGKHHTLSPILIKNNNCYEMYLILRSNLCSKEKPNGLFNTRDEYLWVKKDAIGLIEAQGLFVLSSDLIKKLESIKYALLNNKIIHDFWHIYAKIKAYCNNVFSEESFSNAIKKGLGEICMEILADNAVFKNYTDLIIYINNLF